VIDERAIIDPAAKIAKDVTIGPWSVIGPDVEIGEGTKIGPHVVIKGPTKIGANNAIYQFTSLGEDPQDTTYRGEPTRLEIGDNNIIREFVTINRGTVEGRGITSLGNKNFLMAYVHIAHDCEIGNDVTFVNNTSLAGHVIVKDYARVGGYVGVHQRCQIGQYSMTTAAMVGKDVAPFVIVSGNTAGVYGLNTVGLKRHGFTTEDISGLRKAYNVIFRNGLNMKSVLKELESMVIDCPPVQLFIDAITNSTRGLLR